MKNSTLGFRKRSFALTVLVFVTGLHISAAYAQVTGEPSGPTIVDLCDRETYTITVSNTGTASACSLVVTNTLPNSDFSYGIDSAQIRLPAPGGGTCNLSGASANPTIVGNDLEWDIDGLCGGAPQLGPGQDMTIEFDVDTNCDTLSGTNIVRVDYVDCAAPGTTLDDISSLSIQVNPGAVIIDKTPEVVSAGFGDTVTWTLNIRSSGLGPIEDVVVTDTLGAGLTYVTSTPPVTPVGQTLTWTSNEIPGLSQMDPDTFISIPIQAEVTACENLENVADVRWGCGGGATCFDTAIDGGTATAAVRFDPTSPLLLLRPPAITIDYCGAEETVVVPVENIGNGTAFTPQVCVDFGPLALSNIQGGVTYDPASGCFENIPNINSRATFNLTFDVEYGDWCGDTSSGFLLYIPFYEDECNNPFFPIPRLGSYSLTGSSSSLNVSKTGPTTAYIGESVTYDILVTYSGPLSCGPPPGLTSPVTITDTVPNGFTVSDPGGGIWNPGAGGTGGTIEWIGDPSSTPVLDTSITLDVPGAADCETFCNTTPFNSIQASVTDCCGCVLSASASVTTAIECEEAIVQSSKTVSPTVVEPCDTVTITNTYIFADNPALDDVDLFELTFTERNDNNMEYVAGSMTVTFGGSSLSCQTITDNTPGGTLGVTFGGCETPPNPDPVRNTTLIIEYQMSPTDQSQPQPPCGSPFTFFDWSDLDLGPDTPVGDCLTDREISEVVEITVQPPSMGVSMTSLPLLVENCTVYPVTISVRQLSTVADPYDVRLELSDANYEIVTIVGCNGVQPTNCFSPNQPVPNTLEWTYDDLFATGGNQGTIDLLVQKRCGVGPDLSATLYYDGLCDADGSADDICTASASTRPLLLFRGDIFIEKTPEVIYTATDQVEWTIYVTNSGAGPATNVTVEDTLDTDLTYLSSTVSPDNGDVTTTPGTPTNGVTWVIDSMAAGEVRAITLTADFAGCESLDNSVEAYWGCDYDADGVIDDECQRVGPVTSTVVIPTSNLVSTSRTTTPQSACEVPEATITLRNAGQTNLYELVTSETLPTGLIYAGNPRYRVFDGTTWSPVNTAPDPNPATSPLVWSFADDNGDAFYDLLLEFPRGYILEILFNLRATCDFSGGNLQVATDYRNPCGDPQNTSVGTFAIGVRLPQVSVTKTQISPPAGEPIDCGEQVTWEIQVATPLGQAPVDVIWVEDTMGAGFSNASPSDGGFNGYGGDSQVTTWEFINFEGGRTQTLTLTADSDASGANCNDVDNVVEAFWGCGPDDGDVDGDPGTKPGVEEPGPVICLTPTGVQDTAVGIRLIEPDLSAGLVGSIDACNDSETFELTITNTSTTSTITDLDAVITLPTGLEYVPGTTVVTCPASGGSGDPGGSPGPILEYYDTANPLNNLCDSLGPGQNATISFNLASNCFVTSDIGIEVLYFDCCNTAYTTALTSTIIPNQPVLSITKTPDTDLNCYDPTDTVTWTINVTNTGTGLADWIGVEDTLGSSLVYDSSSPAATNIAGSWVWELGALDVGESHTVQITAHAVQPPDCDPARTRNDVEATWGCSTGPVDGNPITPDYTCQASVVSSASAQVNIPDLTINNLTAYANCTDNQGLVTVDVANIGAGNATGVVVRVTSNCASSPVIADQTIDLAAGTNTVLTFPFTADCDDCPCDFTVTIDPGDIVCECNETNNSLLAGVLCADIDLEKSTNGVDADTPEGPFIAPGDPVIWEYVVTNTGDVALTDITVTDDQGVAISCPTTFLAVGASMTCTATGIATVGQYANQADTSGTPSDSAGNPILDDNGNPLPNVTDTDPSHYFGPTPAIELEKSTNGEDADTPTGPYIVAGDPVTWTYLVTNTGNIALSLTLTDNILGPISCPVAILAAGASTTCTAIGIATVGQYVNQADVSGQPVDSNGNPALDENGNPLPNVTDTDPSHYFGYDPQIDVEKSTNGEDADTPPGPFIVPGDPVTWTYVVTNTGDIDLTNIELNDSILGTITCPATFLAVGASMSCTASGTATAGQYANIADATGTPSDAAGNPILDASGNPLPNVTDTDPSHYLGAVPAIVLEKLTNGEDADTPTGPYILTGDPVTWTYIVTNIGNVPLTNITLNDNRLGPISCPQATLAAGASMICTASGTASAGQYANTANVTGTPSDAAGNPILDASGNPLPNVTDTDPSHYFGYNPAIDIEKSTNGVDADTPPGPNIPEGEPVLWTYVVTNIGDVPLIDITITDDRGVTVNCPQTTLAVGESMICTAVGRAIAGQYANTADVIGTPVDANGNPLPNITDTDPSHYAGLPSRSVPTPIIPSATPSPLPTPTPPPTPTPGTEDVSGLSISKSTNRSSAQPGQIVQFSVTITNDADIPVFNVTVSDSLSQGFLYIDGTASVNGASITAFSAEGGRLTFTLDVIPANGSVVLTYAALVRADVAPGRYTNSASISELQSTSTFVQVPGERLYGQQRFEKRQERVDLSKPCVVVPAELEKPWFMTDIAMYAASEMYNTNQPFVTWSEENGLALDQYFLSPTGVRESGAEMLEFSVDNVNTVMTNAGIGLHLKYAPFIVAGAKAKALSPEEYLEERLQEIAQLSNLTMVPRNAFPIFIEYAEGDPRYTTVVDINNWESLRWDPQSFNNHLIPSAYGQALLRQVLLLEDFLATNHDRDTTRDAAGEFLGVDDARGFIGILAAEGILNKLWFMANELIAYGESESGETIPYFPYQTLVEPESLASEEPEIRVVDDQSRLFDQLSLLWALSELMLLTDPDTPGTSQEIFSQKFLAPDIRFSEIEQPLEFNLSELSAASVHTLAERLAAIVFNTIVEFHYHEDQQTLIERVLMSSSEQQPEDESVEKISTTDLGLSVAALKRYHDAMSRNRGLQQEIEVLIRIAADYLIEQLYDNDDGGFFTNNIFTSEIPDSENQNQEFETQDNDTRSADRSKRLDAQMAAIRGLLAAYDVTNVPRYRTSAYETYTYVENVFWNDDIEVYKDRKQRGLYSYTPMDVGLVIGALRELIYHSEDAQQMLEMAKRIKTFVKQIVKYAGLQLSEVVTRSDQEFLIPVDTISAIRTAQSLDSPFGLAPVLGSEISLNNDAISALQSERPADFDFCAQARNSFRSVYYNTAIGMYAASELGLTREIDGAWNTLYVPADTVESNRNSELLNPVSIERTTAKSGDFSDYNLTHIQAKSSLGVPLQYGPLIQQRAQEKGLTAEDALVQLLTQYAELAGFEKIPEHLMPIFLEYEGGVPEIEYGKGTERWIEANIDKSLIPSALGQTLRRQVLWIKDVLSDRHDERNRVSPTGKYFGRNSEEGFLGLLVAQSVVNKLLFLRDTMLVAIDATGRSTPSGHYFPHRLEVDLNGDDELPTYSLEDESSDLFDQVSLLWGLSELKGLLASDGQKPYHEVFGNEQLVSEDFRTIITDLVRILLENLEVLHWNSQHASLYVVNTLEQQEDEQSPDESEPQSDIISTHAIAMAVIALESVYQRFPEESLLRENAQSLLLAQVNFLYRHLYRDDGAIYNGARLADTVAPLTGLKTLLAHSAAVRSFLIGYRMTQDPLYRQAAERVFDFLDKTFWDERLQVYRSALGGSRYHYTPLNVAMTVGAFRELLILNKAEYLDRMTTRFSKFFEQVVEHIGLQLSEQKHFFELLAQPRTLAPVLASDLIIQPSGAAVDADVPQPGSTIFYTIRVFEESLLCDLANAYIEDILPQGVTFVRSLPAPESIEGRVIRWRVVDLPVDENGVYTIRLEVSVNPRSIVSPFGTDLVSGPRTWNIRNCASLWCQDPGVGDRQIASDCVEDGVTTPLIGLEKSLRTVLLEPGREAEFEIVVTNLSEVTAYTVTIEDHLPEGFIYLDNSARSSDLPDIALDDTQPLVWVLEDLAPEESIRLTYRVVLDRQLEEGVYLTTVRGYAIDRSGGRFEANEFELTLEVKRGVLLDLTQRIPDQETGQGVRTNTSLTVWTEIENVGSDGLIDSTLTVILPKGFRYVPESSRLNDVVIDNPEHDGQIVTWKVGEFPPGVVKTLQYRIQSADDPGSYTLKTIISGITEDGDDYQSQEYTLEILLLPIDDREMQKK